MKKLLLFLLLFSLSGLSVFSQVVIPNAIQQPAWVFPFYFEDGIGQRDTIYLGYDPNAHFFQGPVTSDSIFGERVVTVDTSVFNAATFTYLGVDSGYYFLDSIIKVAIIPQYAPGSNLGYSIVCHNFYLPLKVKWDNTLLYSNSLPFPSQSPLPTAQVLYSLGTLPTTDGNCYVIDAPPLLLTDTSSQPYCVYSDSVLIGWGNGLEWSEGLSIGIFPWTGFRPLGITEMKKEIINLYPNPAINTLAINTDLNLKNAQLQIHNAQGQLVIHSTFDVHLALGDTTFDISSLNSGIYFLTLTNGTEVVSKKFVKE